VNLSHLASTVLLAHFNAGHTVLALPEFRLMLYLAVKHLQGRREIRLHAGLCDPGRYQALLASTPPALEEFLQAAATAGLLRVHEDVLQLDEKLRHAQDFDEIRLQNPLEVYANEVEPLPAVTHAVERAMTEVAHLSGAQRAEYLFDDELKALDWDRALYRKPKHADINDRETATADPTPFLLRPAAPKPLGVVLTHGFLATPAEVRAFGEQLRAAGYPVLGVRLKGHGTSPWDLRHRSWEDWLASIARGVEIMRGITERYVLIGFSTGGSLSLIQAAKADPALAGTIAISAPLKFRNKNLRFVPFMHGANRLVSWLSSYEGVMPFRPNESEHPHINYRNIPLRGLYELTRVVAELKTTLPRVRAPVCVIQGDGDAVVDPESALLIYDKLDIDRKALDWVPSKRHGILYEDIGATRQLALDFLASL
jgi:esterase/lipase